MSSKKQIIFYYENELDATGRGLLEKDRQKLDMFMIDLSEEIYKDTGYKIGIHYYLYIAIDYALAIDSDDDNIYDTLVDYIEGKYDIQFKKQISQGA